MTPQVVLENPSGTRRGFWRRQFGNSATNAQIIFDVIFGILMPVLCFVLDPGILGRNGLVWTRGLSPSGFTLFVYGISCLAIPTLVLWLSVGRRIKGGGGVISGVLMAGAFCSFSLGIIILPLTLLGLFLVIGVLGFTPLVTGFVYLRNAIRALNRSNQGATRTRSVGVLLLGCALTIGVPAVASVQVSRIVDRSMAQILQSNGGSTREAAQRLRYLKWYADVDRIPFAYGEETDPIRKEQLAEAYRIITGDDIERRLYQMRELRD